MSDEAQAQYNYNKIVQPSIPLPLVTLSSTSLNMGLEWRGVHRYLSLLPDLALSQVLNKLVRKSPSCTDTSLPRGAWTPRLAHTLWNINLASWSYLWFWLLSFTWKIEWKKSSEECVVKSSSVMNMLCWYYRLKRLQRLQNLTIVNYKWVFRVDARYAVKSLSAIQIKCQKDAVSKEQKQTPFKD